MPLQQRGQPQQALRPYVHRGEGSGIAADTLAIREINQVQGYSSYPVAATGT
jgi:hypothetical protein